MKTMMTFVDQTNFLIGLIDKQKHKLTYYEDLKIREAVHRFGIRRRVDNTGSKYGLRRRKMFLRIELIEGLRLAKGG